jgi:hypothetical protein
VRTTKLSVIEIQSAAGFRLEILCDINFILGGQKNEAADSELSHFCQ